MKKFLEGAINQGLKTQLKTLYGNNSKVVIEDFFWSRRRKHYNISLTIYTDNIKDSVEVHPEGIEYLLGLGLKMINRDKPTKLISSLKYSENGTSNSTC